VTRRAAIAAALGLLLIVAALGCSKPEKTLDPDATQASIGKVVAARVHVPVDHTACPPTISRAEGNRFNCTVKLVGRVGTVRVRVRQADDRGAVSVTLLDAVIDRSRVADDLKAHLKAKFARGFQADCKAGRQVMAPGETFRCIARDKAGRRSVLVTVVDAQGSVRYQVLG
jgi:hypothetical protein